MRRRAFDWRLCVRLISALALVFVAFAHRPLDARAGGLPDPSAYAFPDGSVPIICVTVPGEEGDQHAVHSLPCDACLIAGSILLPVPTDLAAFEPQPTSDMDFALVEPLLVRQVFPPSAPPQAPPLA